MSSREIASASDVRKAAERLSCVTPSLRELGDARVVQALSAAATKLADPSDPLGRTLRDEARVASGLSPEMVEWCLTTTLSTVTPTALLSVLEQAQGKPPAGTCAVVLAGNVFTAALRAIYLPLVAGAPVIAKAATGDDVLAHHVQLALAATDPEVARSYELVRFAREDDLAMRALLDHANVVSIYGDDASVEQISARARAGTTIIPHGHGLSALYFPKEGLETESSARDLARRVALDIAAYDQHGCLSPHFVVIERGGRIDARRFAQLLATDALPMIEALLPRGPLHAHEKAACLQWRAAASARGELFANPHSAVSYEGPLSLRENPGARHIAIHDCANDAELLASLTPYGTHLKSLGIAGPREIRERITTLFAASPRPPRICRPGEMQTPAFTVPADGLPALHGLICEQ